MRALTTQLAGYTSLQTLDLSHNALGALGVVEVAGLLEALPAITDLDLSATGASDGGTAALATVLASMLDERPDGRAFALRRLNLTGNFIKEGGATALATLLTKQPPLSALGLGWNKV